MNLHEQVYELKARQEHTEIVRLCSQDCSGFLPARIAFLPFASGPSISPRRRGHGGKSRDRIILAPGIPAVRYTGTGIKRHSSTCERTYWAPGGIRR